MSPWRWKRVHWKNQRTKRRSLSCYMAFALLVRYATLYDPGTAGGGGTQLEAEADSSSTPSFTIYHSVLGEKRKYIFAVHRPCCRSSHGGGTVTAKQEGEDRRQSGVVVQPSQPKESAIRSYLTWCKLTEIKCSFFFFLVPLTLVFAKPGTFSRGDK